MKGMVDHGSWCFQTWGSKIGKQQTLSLELAFGIWFIVLPQTWVFCSHVPRHHSIRNRTHSLRIKKFARPTICRWGLKFSSQPTMLWPGLVPSSKLFGRTHMDPDETETLNNRGWFSRWFGLFSNFNYHLVGFLKKKISLFFVKKIEGKDGKTNPIRFHGDLGLVPLWAQGQVQIFQRFAQRCHLL